MSPIVAAVRFDRNASQVVRAALWLARQRRAPLHLTHVFSPVTPSATTEYATARTRLTRMGKAYARTGVEVHIEALIGDYPEALLEHARDVRAGLIISGAHGGSPGFLGTALRPSLSLLAGAPAPVLVLKDDPHARRRLPTAPICVLIADDLTDETQAVLASAAAMAAEHAAPLDVIHLHVDALPAIGFALSPDYQLDVWPAVAIHDRSVREHHEAQLTRLRARAKALAAAVEGAGGRYRAELWHGNVAAELTRAAELLKPEVCVFGRHKLLHRKPLALGHMPFDAMLRMPGAVLVTPHA